jgi:hypothetical protein
LGMPLEVPLETFLGTSLEAPSGKLSGLMWASASELLSLSQPELMWVLMSALKCCCRAGRWR